MAIFSVAKWQSKTCRFLNARDNPLVLDIDTLLTAYHFTGKSDVQKQKILILMLYICTQWLVTKSKNNWRRPYVSDLIGQIEIELRTPEMLQTTQDRIGIGDITLKEDPIELLQPKGRSIKYGLTGGTTFTRLSGHSAKAYVERQADCVDELKILALGNAGQGLQKNLAYGGERQARHLDLGDDNRFHLNHDPAAYTSPDAVPDLCIIDPLELIYVSSIKAAGKFHHSSFRSGKPVVFAGELRV